MQTAEVKQQAENMLIVFEREIAGRPARSLPVFKTKEYWQWQAVQTMSAPICSNEIAEDRALVAVIFTLPGMLFAEKVVRQSDLKAAFKEVRTKAEKFLQFMPDVRENTPQYDHAKNLVEKFTARIQIGGMQHPITVLNALSRIIQERMRKNVLHFKAETMRKEMLRRISDGIFELNEIYAVHFTYRESYERKGKSIASEFIRTETETETKERKLNNVRTKSGKSVHPCRS